MDFKIKIGGRKPVVHNFCRKRELVAMGNQIVGKHRHDTSRATFEPSAFFRYFSDALPTCAATSPERM